jgi:hypothetical protein
MKLIELFLKPEAPIRVTDEIDLIPYSAPEIDDPEVMYYLEMLLNATSISEIRMVLTLAYEAWLRDDLKIDEELFRELARFDDEDEECSKMRVEP